MKKKVFGFLTIPSDVRGAFLSESIQKNHFSLWVICVIIFGAELYNIARVLLWSQAGLGTLNNRIYFGMYCALLAVGVLTLVLQRLLRSAPLRRRWIAQYVMIFLMFAWHIGLNLYDLSRDPQGGTMIFTTAILGLGVFIQMSALYSVPMFVLGYSVFMAIAGPVLDEGTKVNLSITSTVALGVSLTGSRHAVISLQQRREISQINAQLRELVHRDPLTGLLNKTAMQHRVEQCLGQEGKPAALVMLDLDDFGAVNNRYGHPCGDHVLEETGRLLRSVFSDADGIGRVGGDEFAVILTRAIDAEEAAALGDRLIREISAIRWQGRLVGACGSIGICLSEEGAAPFSQLYQETDQALYDAKRSGKGCCRCRFLPAGGAQTPRPIS